MAESALDLPLRRRRLDRRGTRWLLGIIESFRLTRRRHSLVIVRPWKEWWVHRHRDGSFVHPGLKGIPPRRLAIIALDTFCHGYTPVAGDVIVDVGAGIGEELLVFSRLVGNQGRIVCVEAHPTTYERLLATIKLNRLKNVEASNLAIADRAGLAQISDKPIEDYISNTLVQPEGSLAVPADTLDGLYERFGLQQVDLLKMNIEGAEALAISGWPEALRRTRHVVVACHDFLLETGAPADFATFDRVKNAVEEAGFTVTTRPDDPKPWNRDYVYGTRKSR